LEKVAKSSKIVFPLIVPPVVEKALISERILSAVL
jgi:hypothetical protein